jgi:hypothetical protein
MIFTGFKRKTNQIFLNKRQSKLLKETSQVSFNKTPNFLVICDEYTQKEEITYQLLANFNISTDAITWLFFQQNISKELVSDQFISPKDFGWYGTIKSQNLKHILTKKYDLLINYSKIENVFTNVVLLQSNVGFKAGFLHLNSNYYDLLIDCKAIDFTVFTKELRKYLAILKYVE